MTTNHVLSYFMNRNQKILLATLLIILALCLIIKIDLFTADLGRHLKNGEIILTDSAEARNAVLTTNYYSYAEGSSPFINHHWLSGVIFFLFFNLFGFSGLSFLYLVFMLIAFWLVFDLIRDKINPFAIFAISLIVIPIIASRAEVRPEVFTYLFVALFIWICFRYSEGKINQRWLWLLPVLQIIWINVHIGFVFGPFIIGVFLLTFLIQKDFSKVKNIGLILFTSCLALLANPAHIYGAIYPFNIFGEYSYRVLENQSVGFLDNLSVGNPYTFYSYKILLVLVLLSYIIVAFINWRKLSLPFFIFSLVFGIMGWLAIRDFPLFGLVGIASLIMNIKIIYDYGGDKFGFLNKEEFLVPVFVGLILVGAVMTIGLIVKRSGSFGVGITNGVNNAAQFFKVNNIKGLIFNNYDIGGYLIYNLFPSEKVFFDNRPETYAKKFVDEEYIKAMEDPEVFKKLDEKYKFNAIFFYYRDYTPWGQAFITKKVFDPDWAPVYADLYSLILLKRNSQNNSLIHNYEIPKESFTISR
ncbi:MAG: hypothetical protein UU95_C0033G0006 [Parcubacteria group bacterium GW2011_GWC2_42_12]|nr:MAG: hypothetical protein UU95_C0033G0006 [Parcubacteria group bacterium GW2011_GWC2_42_12]